MWIKEQILRTQYGDGLGGELFEGDAGQSLKTLKAYEGKINTIYLDPPYLTGDVFFCRLKIGEQGALTGKPYTLLPAYHDRFAGREDYFCMLTPLLKTALALLTANGTLFLHLDWRMSAYARVCLDELMGEGCFVNEIIWAYESGGRASKHFSRKHDVILMYRKSRKAYFDITQVPMDRKTARHNHMRRQTDENGRAYYSINTGGKIYTYYEDTPVYPSDVWADISHLQQKDPERSGYDTQKPLALLQRILRPTTRPSDWVADLCFGSGTTLVCAAKEGRRFLGVDASPSALSTAAKRLIDVGFCVTRQADMSDARLDAQLLVNGDKREMVLNDFSFLPSPDIIPREYRVQPLDWVDQWAAGVISNGVFIAGQRCVRTKEMPQLSTTLLLPEAKGRPAIEIIDVLSRKHVFGLVD